MMSTGGSFAPSSLVMSPTWIISGNRSFVTLMGNGSISLAQRAVMPFRRAARGNPPMPSKRLPMVIIASHLLLHCRRKVPSEPHHRLGSVHRRHDIGPCAGIHPELLGHTGDLGGGEHEAAA